MSDLYSFPPDFTWGTATSSFQIEGALEEDGRGVSTWDTFMKRPGKILNSDQADIACDHYHNYQTDIKMMKEIGLNAYRLSIAWSRIFPEGKGKINQKGLDFYDSLIDHLLENKITPFVTLFHWDLPQALEDEYQGWRNKEVAHFFADYAQLIAKHFSDRVQHWNTINEISCFTIMAHRDDRHAPGKKMPPQVIHQSVHNALLGHGLAVQAIRQAAKKTPYIGIVENLKCTWPVYHTPPHIKAAKKAWQDLNQAILFPLFKGQYDPAFLNQLGQDQPDFTDQELKTISTPCDFIGYNIYFGQPVRAAENEKGYEILQYPAKYPTTDMDWPISPKAIYYPLLFTKEEFNNIPVYITENGAAFVDQVTENEEVPDLDRIEYIRTHLEMAWRAIHDGCALKGYFLWSLLDNFEWSYGYAKRFGIVRVNYATQKRILKMSGQFYSEIIKSNKIL